MEFVCPDPNAVVRAANVRSTLDAFLLLPSIGERLVARHRLNVRDLTPDKFVPVQRWLDALREIQESVGPNVVRDVGARIIENADFPPEFPTVEAILGGLDAIYHLNHRGEVGHYRTSRHGDNIVVSCETPYPRHFEFGLIEGICRNKAARGRGYAIDFEEGRPGDAVSCVVKVRVRQRRVALERFVGGSGRGAWCVFSPRLTGNRPALTNAPACR
jgi:hypothetical protein